MAAKARWGWIIPVILLAAVGISLLRRAPETAGEKLLAAVNAHHLPTREALLLLDYSPDRDLLASERTYPVQQGAGPAPGLGVEPAATVDQHWLRIHDATLFWPREKNIRAALPNALAQLHDLIDAITLSTAADHLQKLTDEQLFLAWIHADRGVIAELNDPTAAAEQALLLAAAQSPGPILTFPIADHHVYLLPDEKLADAVWCDLVLFDPDGTLTWCAVLRIDGSPAPQHVRTMAVLLTEEALKPPATTPAIPHLTHF